MDPHDEQLVADVSDGDQVVDGVEPPTAAELAAAKRMTDAQLEVTIDAHLAQVKP